MEGKNDEETPSQASSHSDMCNYEEDMAPPKESLERRRKGKGSVVSPHDAPIVTREDQYVAGGEGKGKGYGGQVVQEDTWLPKDTAVEFAEPLLKYTSFS